MNTIVNPAPRPEGQGLFLRCWVKTGLILGWAVLGLMGCSPDLDGIYVANHLADYSPDSRSFHTRKTQLIIKGDRALFVDPLTRAEIKGSIRRRLNPTSITSQYLGTSNATTYKNVFYVKYADNRILIYSRTPMDGMVFHVTNEGNTLKCLLCESVKKPVIWERFDAWYEGDPLEDAQDDEE